MGTLVYIVINDGKIKLVTQNAELANEVKLREINDYYMSGGLMGHKVKLEDHIIKN